jgi:ubiquinone/menaquinone biosynthesis C-methylase UbiE
MVAFGRVDVGNLMTTTAVSVSGPRRIQQQPPPLPPQIATRSMSTSQQDRPQRPSSYIDGPDTHFGFENVKIEEKEGRVRQVFENVADSYDIMNDLMSGGLHRYWKDTLLEKSAVRPMATAIREQENKRAIQVPDLRILDVAGGTGDVAFRFVEAAGCLERAKAARNSIGGSGGSDDGTSTSSPDPISITVCDINAEMLRVGRARAVERFGEDLVKDGIGGSMNKENNKSSEDIIADGHHQSSLSFVQGNAQDLCDFEDNTFDLYTIAFGLRNVTDVVSRHLR